MRNNFTIKPELIGFDIDCVVADTMEAFIRLALEDYNVRVLPEYITSFEVEKCLSVDSSIITEIFDRLLKFPLENKLKPMPHSVTVLTELANHAPLTFITARPFEEPIDNWLRDILPSATYAKSHLVAMGDHDCKVQHVANLGLQYFVDDRVHTCKQLALAGFSPVVFSHPWNQGRHSFLAVDCWQELRKRIDL
ncbi:MAG: hypothetical protein KQH63_06465 [Desulfobulbaceae bacterium]|nr:hypothetical protein [Desulfobulbaceae bacterium]